MFLITCSSIIGIIKAKFEHLSVSGTTSVYYPSYLSLVFGCFIQVLILPILYISIKTFGCTYISSVISCKSAVHIILTIIAVVNGLSVIFFSVLISCFYADESPKSKLPWALCDIRIKLAHAGKHIANAVILSTEFYNSSFIFCLAILIIFDLFSVYSHLTSASYLYRVPQVIDVVSSTTTGFFAIWFLFFYVFLNILTLVFQYRNESAFSFSYYYSLFDYN